MVLSAQSWAACGHGRVCPDTDHSEAVRECIQALTSNSYDISYGNRIGICGAVRSSFGVEAVRAAAQARKGISDSTLSALVQVDNPYAVRAVRAFTNNNYDIDYGNRAALCRGVDNPLAAAAIEDATRASKGISDSALSSLARVVAPAGELCVRAFTENNYDIDYGNRAGLCATAYSREGAEAVRLAVQAGKGISDSTLSGLLRVNNGPGLGCVAAFTRNNYDIDYGNRASICATFCSEDGVAALRAIAESGSGIDDTELSRLAQITRY